MFAFYIFVIMVIKNNMLLKKKQKHLNTHMTKGKYQKITKCTEMLVLRDCTNEPLHFVGFSESYGVPMVPLRPPHFRFSVATNSSITSKVNNKLRIYNTRIGCPIVISLYYSILIFKRH